MSAAKTVEDTGWRKMLSACAYSFKNIPRETNTQRHDDDYIRSCTSLCRHRPDNNNNSSVEKWAALGVMKATAMSLDAIVKSVKRKPSLGCPDNQTVIQKKMSNNGTEPSNLLLLLDIILSVLRCSGCFVCSAFDILRSHTIVWSKRLFSFAQINKLNKNSLFVADVTRCSGRIAL